MSRKNVKGTVVNKQTGKRRLRGTRVVDKRSGRRYAVKK